MVARNIRGVVERYCTGLNAGRPVVIDHGFELDPDEERRRFAILSILYDGLDRPAFASRFGREALTCFAEQWEALVVERCVTVGERDVRLTPRGVRHADVVGQLFFSERVCRLVDAYEYDA
jgi:coproporphyrinogen III oxidase-like Fe-S oxidoreductase